MLSWFSLVRGINILVLIIAQYFTARYIMDFNRGWRAILLDLNLFCLVFATALSASAGYIINNFYDAEKDRINHPNKYLLEHLNSQHSQLILYLLLNMAALIIASAISFRAVLFFTVYIFWIWLYSNTIKRLFWLSNLVSTALMIYPFFGLTLFFENYTPVVFIHASFLTLLLLIRDMIKDLKNLKGDWVQRYQTLPVVFSVRASKIIISVLVFLTALPIYFLLEHPLGLMRYYFIFSIAYLLVFLSYFWVATDQKAYLRAHNGIKFLIFLGVLSIYLIHK